MTSCHLRLPANSITSGTNNHWRRMTTLWTSENDQDFHQALWQQGTVCNPGFVTILRSHHRLHSSHPRPSSSTSTIWNTFKLWEVSEFKKSKDLWFKAWALTSICNIDAQVFKVWRDEERSFCDIFCNRIIRFLESYQHRSCWHCYENSQRNSILASLLEDEAWYCEPDDLPGDSVTGELSCVGDGTTNHAHIQVANGWRRLKRIYYVC